MKLLKILKGVTKILAGAAAITVGIVGFITAPLTLTTGCVLGFVAIPGGIALAASGISDIRKASSKVKKEPRTVFQYEDEKPVKPKITYASPQAERKRNLNVSTIYSPRSTVSEDNITQTTPRLKK